MNRLQTIWESINVLSIDNSKCPDECEYCKKPGELRPYGKDGAWICFDCGMDPNNVADTEAAFADILDGNGNGAVKIVSLTEAMKTKQVEARYLEVGDYLPFIKATVVVGPSAGINTPSGKTDLTVEFENGKRQTKTWNKNTKISVREND